MWLSNSSVGRKVVMSVTGIALNCRVGFSKHVGVRHYRYRRPRFAPLQLLGKNAVAGTDAQPGHAR